MSARHAVFTAFAVNTWGHLERALAIADRLAAAGTRVTFAITPEARALVRSRGFASVELRAMARQDLLRASARAAASVRWYRRELAEVRRCLHALAPDVVVADMVPIVNVAAALDAVPSASIVNLELLGEPLGWWLAGLDRVFAALELPRWARARVFGDALIVADVPDATGLRDLEPSLLGAVGASVREVRHVGPILRERARWARSRRRRPRVIVSFGRILIEHWSGLALPSLAAIPADYTVITGERPSSRLRAAIAAARGPARFRFVAYLPDFARRLAAADALITHGGHGTLLQALAVGIPTLVVPTTREQELNAERMRGLGEVVAPTEPGLRAARDQLAVLLEDRARDRARRRMAERLARFDGAGEAARTIEGLAAAV